MNPDLRPNKVRSFLAAGIGSMVSGAIIAFVALVSIKIVPLGDSDTWSIVVAFLISFFGLASTTFLYFNKSHSKNIAIPISASIAVLGLGVAGASWLLANRYANDERSVYFVCIGSSQAACGVSSSSVWLPCGSDIAKWAGTANPRKCAKVDIQRISDRDGGACGFLTAAVTCHSR